jgi:hypothetical protein
MPHVYSDDPSEVPYSTTLLEMILTSERRLTISNIPPPFLNDLTKRYAKPLATAQRHRLVLLWFLAIVQSDLLYLRHLENHMDAIQRKIQISYRTKSCGNSCPTNGV